MKIAKVQLKRCKQVFCLSLPLSNIKVRNGPPSANRACSTASQGSCNVHSMCPPTSPYPTIFASIKPTFKNVAKVGHHQNASSVVKGLITNTCTAKCDKISVFQYLMSTSNFLTGVGKYLKNCKRQGVLHITTIALFPDSPQ